MKSREQIAIEALQPCPFCGCAPIAQEIEAHTHAGGIAGFMPDHHGSFTIECPTANCCGMIASKLSDVAAAWNRRSPTAQGSIDADDLPLLPLGDFGTFHSRHEGGVERYSADQMRAYVLADRAARQSAAPGGMGDEWHSLTCDGTCSPPCKDAPAPSEPVPQGVPICNKHKTNFEMTPWGMSCAFCEAEADNPRINYPTATTATSGGEAVGVIIKDLSMLVSRLAIALKKAEPGHELPAKAGEYLKRKDLIGSPLRTFGDRFGDLNAPAPFPPKKGN